MIFKKSIFISALFITGSIFAQTKSLNWTIKHDTWTESDEKRFSTFVYEIGMGKEKGKCHRVGQCLSNKDVNKRYYAISPRNLAIQGYFGKSGGHVGDCSFAPYILRAYFAWMNDLPFAFPTRARVNSGNVHKEIRLNTNGGQITQWDQVKTGDNFNTVLGKARSVYTVLFRVSASEEDTVKGEPNTSNYVVNPLYSADISYKSITPGTVLYSANKGHVLVVYKVTEEGDIWFIDGHPDNSLSRKRFGNSYFYPRPIKLGAGFFKWRNFKIKNYTKDSKGNIIGGYYEALKDSEHTDYSLKQFDYVRVDSKNYTIDNMDYFDYVQKNVGLSNIKLNLLDKFSERMDELCESLVERHKTVVDGIEHGIHRKAHIPRLPKNIYATSHHEWEAYSTPSRDMAFKGNIISNLSYFKRLVKRYYAGDDKVVYNGSNVKADLLKIYNQKSQCYINYKNTRGSNVKVTLDQGIDRLFKLSFDPYHCIELRWGASGSELYSCNDDSEKMLWYEAEQRLRNVVSGGHEIELSMEKTARELLADTDLGDDEVDALEYNIRSYLNSL